MAASLFPLFFPLPTAKAALQDDVANLLNQAGAHHIHHLGPRILEQGEELPLLVPPNLLTDSANTCTHLVVLAAQSIHFACVSASDDSAETESRVVSRAGLVELSKCGKARSQLSDIVVTMASRRAPIEVIAYTSPVAIKRARSLLTSRNIGLEAPERDVRRASEFPELEAWGRQSEYGSTLKGATRTERRNLPTQDKALGETMLGFDPGCHEIRLLIDVDMDNLDAVDKSIELIWQDNERVATSGTWQARSPLLLTCTATPRVAKMYYPSLPQAVTGVLFRAHYQWPAGVPVHWAIPVRNRIARAMMQRQLMALKTAPARSWMGGATAIELKTPVVRRNCYVAIVAATIGDAGDIYMSVSSGAGGVADNSVDGAIASAAFCPIEDETVTIGIDAREANSTWIAGLWNVTNLQPAPDMQ